MPTSIVLKEYPGLTREQKIGFFLLLAFGIMAVALGVLQIRNTLYRPLALNSQIPATVRREVVDNVDALRFRDTDHDDLSDFDELYVYGTSPYLADTDSDGIPDKQELDRQTNPLCPEGQDCSQFIISENTSAPTSSVTSSLNLGVEAPGEAPPDLNVILRDPAQLRALLLQAGMSRAVLDKVSDKDLLQMVQEVLKVSPTSTWGSGLPPRAPASGG